MPIINLPTKSMTAEAMNKAIVDDYRERDGDGIGMSQIDTQCDRALWYLLRWASPNEKITPELIRRFDDGNHTETQLLSELKLVPGVTLWDTDHSTGRQFKVTAAGGHVRGRLDGEALGIPDAPATIHVVEAKSHNAKSFADLEKNGVKKSKPSHWWQCQFYMYGRGRQRALYLAKNKDNSELYVEHIEYDVVAVTQMKARLERIIKSENAPPRIGDRPDQWPCMFCRHKYVCYKHDFGRKHCRTCIHSTPIVENGSTEARWDCARHSKTLTRDEQREGCKQHLFHPDVVPGKQVDAGEFWISYELNDGTEWEDQEDV